MCIAVAFILATTLSHANECPSGDECPSDNKDTMSLLQTNLQMNVLKDGGEDTTGETGGGLGKMVGDGEAAGAHTALDSQSPGGTIKLIVNSDVRYSVALDKLFESMEKVSFGRWNDVIVMRGSASNGSDPFTPETKYGKRGVTYIDLKLSSFDLHGFAGLHHHHNDPSVKANVYFYIHDTVLVSSTFPSIFDSMASTEEFEARHSPLPSKNQCVFGSGVVDAYSWYFDFPKSKTDGFCIENALPPYKNVVNFAKKQTLLEKGIDGTAVDLYGTGLPRQPTYFPSLGITKYSLLDVYGDLTGDVKKYEYWSLLETSKGPQGVDKLALKAALLQLAPRSPALKAALLELSPGSSADGRL